MPNKPDYSFDPQILIGLRRIVGKPINPAISEEKRKRLLDAKLRRQAKRDKFKAHHFVYSQAGRPATMCETNDCTVKTLAHATGISYTEAHNICASYGRKPRRAHKDWFRMMLEISRGLEHSLAHLKFQRVSYVGTRDCSTLEAFVEKHPHGTFILDIRNHVFAVKDGKVYDAFLPQSRSRLIQAWQVVRP